jgi:hypothetical protein
MSMLVLIIVVLVIIIVVKKLWKNCGCGLGGREWCTACSLALLLSRYTFILRHRLGSSTTDVAYCLPEVASCLHSP